jgi:hypothetical protein
MRWSLLALITVALFALTPAGDRAAAQESPLRVTLTLERSAVEHGSPLRLTIQVRNTSAQSVTVAFPSGQQYDVVIRSEAVEVARLSEERLYTQATSERRFAPNETVTFTESWLPLNALAPTDVATQKPPLAAGVYTIRAVLSGATPRSASEPQTLIIGTAVALVPGCTTLRAASTALTVLQISRALEPASVLQSLWAFDPTVRQHLGFSPEVGAPRDLTTVAAGVSPVICVDTAAQIIWPG